MIGQGFDDTEFELVRRARVAYEGKDWPVVVSCYQQFLGLKAIHMATEVTGELLTEVARAHSSLATAHLNLRNGAQAIFHARIAVEESEKLVAMRPQDESPWQQLSFHFAYLGTVYMHECLWEQAADSLQNALECYEVVRVRYPDTSSSTAETARSALQKVVASKA